MRFWWLYNFLSCQLLSCGFLFVLCASQLTQLFFLFITFEFIICVFKRSQHSHQICTLRSIGKKRVPSCAPAVLQRRKNSIDAFPISKPCQFCGGTGRTAPRCNHTISSSSGELCEKSKAAESVYNVIPAESWRTSFVAVFIGKVTPYHQMLKPQEGLMHSEEYPGPSPSRTIQQ